MKAFARAVPTLALLMFSGVGAVGCARSERPAPGAPAVAASAAPAAPVTPQSGGAAEPVRAGGRMVMSEIQLSLRSEHPARIADRVSLAVSNAGGFVLSRDASSADETVVRVAMVLRVPVEKLEATLAELRQGATVLDESR